MVYTLSGIQKAGDRSTERVSNFVSFFEGGMKSASFQGKVLPNVYETCS
jgi:hypothetical protein